MVSLRVLTLQPITLILPSQVYPLTLPLHLTTSSLSMTPLLVAGRRLQLPLLHCRVLRVRKVSLEPQALQERLEPKARRVKSVLKV
jgi:hypothetical protein